MSDLWEKNYNIINRLCGLNVKKCINILDKLVQTNDHSNVFALTMLVTLHNRHVFSAQMVCKNSQIEWSLWKHGYTVGFIKSWWIMSLPMKWGDILFLPPLSVRPSVRLSVRHTFVSALYLLNPLWDLQITLHKCQVWWDDVQCQCLTKVGSRSRSQS